MFYARILFSPEIWVMRIMQAHHAVRTFFIAISIKIFVNKIQFIKGHISLDVKVSLK